MMFLLDRKLFVTDLSHCCISTALLYLLFIASASESNEGIPIFSTSDAFCYTHSLSGLYWPCILLTIFLLNRPFLSLYRANSPGEKVLHHGHSFECSFIDDFSCFVIFMCMCQKSLWCLYVKCTVSLHSVHIIVLHILSMRDDQLLSACTLDS